MTPRSRRALCAGLLVLSTLALHRGWRLLWFLTDDAFIHFRYVGNSVLGYGYVWNPPPFLPVEGYTSFLWVALLDLAWRATGILPPGAANGLALAFSAASLWLTAWVVLHMRLGDRLEPHRPWFLGLVLLGLVTHRTFLTWTSSGLETAMFDFWVLAWLVVGLRFSERRRPGSGLVLASLAALIYLTRPEGLLFTAATALMLVAAAFEGRARRGCAARVLAAASPLAAVPLHMAWRVRFYGDWLPNTYHAKYVGPWPESGARYLLSYTLEHALWFWALLLALFAPRLVRARWNALRRSSQGVGALDGWIRAGAIADLAVATFLAGVLYYTFVVGGDTFEYRIYAQVVPPILLSCVWLLDRAGLSGRTSLAALSAFVALAAPLAWTHWRLALDVPRAVAAQEDLPVPVAASLPRFLRWYGELFDRTQAWLVPHLVCGRHHSHVSFTEHQLQSYPERDLTARMPLDDIPVLLADAVGVAGWSLPHVAVIDEHGLNDYVAARTPLPGGRVRRMAHDRHAPEEYVAAFRPNVKLVPGKRRVRIRSRAGAPLTPEQVVEIEHRWRARVQPP